MSRTKNYIDEMLEQGVDLLSIENDIYDEISELEVELD